MQGTIGPRATFPRSRLAQKSLEALAPLNLKRTIGQGDPFLLAALEGVEVRKQHADSGRDQNGKEGLLGELLQKGTIALVFYRSPSG
jgi:hypothetical protein